MKTQKQIDDREYYERNRTAILERQKEYNAHNSEGNKLYQAHYRKKSVNKQKAYRQMNRDRINAQQRERYRRKKFPCADT